MWLWTVSPEYTHVKNKWDFPAVLTWSPTSSRRELCVCVRVRAACVELNTSGGFSQFQLAQADDDVFSCDHLLSLLSPLHVLLFIFQPGAHVLPQPLFLVLFFHLCLFNLSFVRHLTFPSFLFVGLSKLPLEEKKAIPQKILNLTYWYCLEIPTEMFTSWKYSWYAITILKMCEIYHLHFVQFSLNLLN